MHLYASPRWDRTVLAALIAHIPLPTQKDLPKTEHSPSTASHFLSAKSPAFPSKQVNVTFMIPSREVEE